MKSIEEIINGFKSLPELPVSEEMLGAYLEGGLSDTEYFSINELLTEELRNIVQEIRQNDPDGDGNSDIFNIDDVKLPILEGIFEKTGDDIDDYTDMKEILSAVSDVAEESNIDVSAHMSVGEDVIDIKSPHVLQSYKDTCAIKSQQLVLEKFGKILTEDELVQQAYENGWYRPGYGTSMVNMGELLKANGVPCTNITNGNIAQVVSALADGKQIIMGVDSGELWDSQKLPKLHKLWEHIEDHIPLLGGADHALLVTGIDASDPLDIKVIVTDPGSGDLDKPYPLKQFIDAAEDSRFFMTVTDNPAPNIFDAFAPGTTHLPKIGDMNYYDFMNKFSDYMHDGDAIPNNVWNDFKLSAFGATDVDDISQIDLRDWGKESEVESLKDFDEPADDNEALDKGLASSTEEEKEEDEDESKGEDNDNSEDDGDDKYAEGDEQKDEDDKKDDEDDEEKEENLDDEDNDDGYDEA